MSECDGLFMRFFRDPAFGHGEASWAVYDRMESQTCEKREYRRRSAPVAVILSTFNGAEFLDRQISSILGQTWPHVRLLIRDDGSTDGTWRLLQEWRRDPRVIALRGRNVGVKASFLQMLGLIDPTTEFVAFADQDDIWLPGKIERGVVALTARQTRRPALYCSRGFVADRASNVIGMTPCWPRPPSFGNALVENIAAGSTVLLNPPAVALIKSAGVPSGAIMHDWWSYLVVSALGTVIFDPRPSVLLRRRDKSLFGAAAATAACRLSMHGSHDSLALILDQAESFLAHFGDCQSLGVAQRRLAAGLVRSSFLERRALVADGRLYRQFEPDNLLFRLRLMLGPWPARRRRPFFPRVGCVIGRSP